MVWITVTQRRCSLSLDVDLADAGTQLRDGSCHRSQRPYLSVVLVVVAAGMW